MINTPRYKNEEADLLERLRAIVIDLGCGKVDGTAYDTAWVARLAGRYPGRGFEAAVDWLRKNQHDNGTWGTTNRHFHDHYISTLAAMVALREVNTDPRDERRVLRGEDALWRMVAYLSHDSFDSNSFPIVSRQLIDRARQLGLDVADPPFRHKDTYFKQIDALDSSPEWSANRLSLSLEGLPADKRPQMLHAEHFAAISVSPASAAAYLLDNECEPLLASMEQAVADSDAGAIRAFSGTDTLEMIWALDHMRTAGVVRPSDPEVRRVLDSLWSAWSPEYGITFTSRLSIPDVDHTAVCFTLLRWGGYDVSADVFARYYQGQYFCRYPDEPNYSAGAQVRVLAALRMAEDHPRATEWIAQIDNILLDTDKNGSFWTDTLHSSPYMLTRTASKALRGVDDILAQSRFKWILHTQNDDGGWGFFSKSSPEETAYCLEALLEWDDETLSVPPELISSAAEYLKKHVEQEPYTPLWLGKTLFTPVYPVKAAILSALYGYAIRNRTNGQ